MSKILNRHLIVFLSKITKFNIFKIKCSNIKYQENIENTEKPYNSDDFKGEFLDN